MVSQNIFKIGLCLFIKVVKLFCESWCAPRVCLEFTFIMVMEVLTEDGWLLTELLYTDYLALCGESLIEGTDKCRRWKNAVEGKSLRVNVDKTKGMQLLFGKKNSVLKVDPYGVCGVWIGCNYI